MLNKFTWMNHTKNIRELRRIACYEVRDMHATLLSAGHAANTRNTSSTVHPNSMTVAFNCALALALPAVSAFSSGAASIGAQYATMTPAQTDILQHSFPPRLHSAENTFGRRPSGDGACRRLYRTSRPHLMTAGGKFCFLSVGEKLELNSRT